jgi:hypothetical protein
MRHTAPHVNGGPVDIQIGAKHWGLQCLLASTAVEQPKERWQEPLVEAGTTSEPGIVDIASLLGAPIVTVVRSTL